MALRMQNTFASFRRAVVEILTSMPLMIIDAVAIRPEGGEYFRFADFNFQHGGTNFQLPI
eukprot:5530612-Amphidinium_carterae.1